VTPQRDGRGRLYTEADLERLRLLNAAVRRGHAIGRIAVLSDEELRELTSAAGPDVAKHQTTASPGVKVSHQGVLAAIRSMDYAVAERELASLAAIIPPREIVRQVALPLMDNVGEDWHAGRLSIAQEHMTSSLLRNLMGALIPLYRRSTVAGKVLFATPSGEHHEFGILLSAMLAAVGGLGIIYLGADLPADEILTAAQKTAPQAVIMGFVGANGAASGLSDLRRVAERLPAQIELWVGGTRDPAFVDEIRKTRALLIEDFDMLEQHLSRLGARF
jgi:methanogenic corrinoid protein MtbC1